MQFFDSKLIFLLIHVIFVNVKSEGYDGFKIFDLRPKTSEQCQLILNLPLYSGLYEHFAVCRFPHYKTSRLLVSPNGQPKLLQFIKQHDIEFDIFNTNVGDTLRQAYETDRQIRTQHPYKRNGRLSTERYYSHDEINNYIADLTVRYPNRTYIKTVGKSYEGRLMKTLTITNGDGRANKNVILMDGAFHAREWISPSAVLYAIEQLVEKYHENAELLEDYDWVVLPVVNADGYEYTQIDATTRLWRKTRKPSNDPAAGTCVGTDPNRNFDFHWNEEGASPDPCSNTYAGPTAFSEPEAIVVRDLIHTYSKRGIMYLTVHSHGRLILYPWGWSSDLPDTWEDLHEVADAGRMAILEATAQNWTIGSSTNVLYVAAGASDDYAFNAGFPISFTMELPGGGSNMFDPPATLIDEYVKETWHGMRAMAKKVVEKYPLK